MPDCWLEVSIQKVLRPATSTQVSLGFPLSISKCWDGSQDFNILLHASHVALPTEICYIIASYLCYLYFIFIYTQYNHCHRVTAHLQLNILLLLLLSETFSVTTPCTVTLNGNTATYECVVICGGGFEKFLVEYTVRGAVQVTARS